MKKVAKVVLVDPDDKYLLMYRSDHPVFGHDPDLPGGILDEGETMLETMIREVKEEIGVTLQPEVAKQLYLGTEYSTHGTLYVLFIYKLDIRPTLVVSWEHSSYEWLDKDEFLARAKAAKDTYMHMVHDLLSAATK